MQISIQFGASSTFQEWSNFKGLLNQPKSGQQPFLQNNTRVENLVYHLGKKLQEAAEPKVIVVDEKELPSFPPNRFIKLVA
jgi:hypothetical protein